MESLPVLLCRFKGVAPVFRATATWCCEIKSSCLLGRKRKGTTLSGGTGKFEESSGTMVTIVWAKALQCQPSSLWIMVCRTNEIFHFDFPWTSDLLFLFYFFVALDYNIFVARRSQINLAQIFFPITGEDIKYHGLQTLRQTCGQITELKWKVGNCTGCGLYSTSFGFGHMSNTAH